MKQLKKEKQVAREAEEKKLSRRVRPGEVKPPPENDYDYDNDDNDTRGDEAKRMAKLRRELQREAEQEEEMDDDEAAADTEGEGSVEYSSILRFLLAHLAGWEQRDSLVSLV